jgi:hypothetical protein
MAIIRAPRPQSGYYVLQNHITNDNRLTWAARGILIFLLAKPDHWEVSTQALIAETAGTRNPLGRDGVRAALSELIEAGYMTRTPRRIAGGVWSGYDYRVCETPETAKPGPDDPPEPAKPATAKPGPANPAPLVSTDSKEVLNKTLVSTDKAAPAVAEPAGKSSKKPTKRERNIAFLIAQGVEPKHAADWMTARDGAEVTETVWEKLCSEAAKANMKPAQAVAYAAAASWRGFNAEWLQRNAPKQSAADKRRQGLGKSLGLIPTESEQRQLTNGNAQGDWIDV